MALSIRDLKALLGKHQNYLTQNGEINTPLLYRYAQECNTDLLTLLSNDDDARNEFFIRHGEHIIFVRDRFIDYIHHKDFLANSYTAYKNKVGLAGLARYGDLSLLKSMHEVVLSFPFKDCVLEGGQNKDEAKRTERYYNRVLAANEIDRLLDPKVLTNAQRYTEHERQPLTEFTRDANINEQRGSSADTITDNLIIKGNNLLALHTLREQFAHKVKLIYIDPPYNPKSPNNTFCYNNNFNRSTWLVFMKNRLEVAKEMLTFDGSMIIAIDDNERDYLGVLLRELFTEENYEIHCITIVHNPRGVQGTNFSYIHEYAFFVIPKGKKTIINQKIEEEKITWSNLRNWGTESLRSDAKNCFYPIIVEKDSKQIIGFGEVCKDSFSPKARMIDKQNSYYIYPVDDKGTERKWRYARQSVETVKHLLKVREVKGIYDVQIGKDFRQYPTVWQNNKYDANEYGTKLIKSLVPNCRFNFPKSLWTVYDCIYSIVGEDKNAIILDYHAGSGTTAHAVLELNKKDNGNRQFILCEQMEYVESITNQRIQAVLRKNNLGGNFVYFELKAHNQTFISHIAAATTTKELLAIKADILAKADLDYRLDTKMVAQSPEEFSALSQEYQKQILLDFLEINQLYVPYTERDDTRFACTDEEKHISEMFYGEENE